MTDCISCTYKTIAEYKEKQQDMISEETLMIKDLADLYVIKKQHDAQSAVYERTLNYNRTRINGMKTSIHEVIQKRIETYVELKTILKSVKSDLGEKEARNIFSREIQNNSNMQDTQYKKEHELIEHETLILKCLANIYFKRKQNASLMEDAEKRSQIREQIRYLRSNLDKLIENRIQSYVLMKQITKAPHQRSHAHSEENLRGKRSQSYLSSDEEEEEEEEDIETINERRRRLFLPPLEQDIYTGLAFKKR